MTLKGLKVSLGFVVFKCRIWSLGHYRPDFFVAGVIRDKLKLICCYSQFILQLANSLRPSLQATFDKTIRKIICNHP